MTKYDNFTKECLDLYKEFSDNQTRTSFFTECVNDRLDNLLISNSQLMDETISKLEQYFDSVLVENIPFVRCDNYKRMKRTCVKSNNNYIAKLLKTYNKSCIMSTKLLLDLTKQINY